MEYFSNILSSLLAEKALTQQELCKKLNFSKNQMHYWVKNKAEPDLESLVKLARYFDVTVDYLLGLEDEFGNKV